MSDIKIALIQSHIYWEKIDQNLEHFSRLADSVHVDTDLILLPEMFTTGFSMQTQWAQKSGEKALEWLQKTAQEHRAMVIGTAMTACNGLYYNRLYAVFPDGSYKTYDKKHLFSMGKENRYYTAGDQKLILEYKGWKIAPLTCYDLRFPAWCRLGGPFDLVTFHANWPQRRIHHWDLLLRARAVENLCYVTAVNRVGLDGNEIAHNGSSQIIAPDGEVLCQVHNETQVIHYHLSKSKLKETRKSYPFLKDQDLLSIQ